MGDPSSLLQTIQAQAEPPIVHIKVTEPLRPLQSIHVWNDEDVKQTILEEDNDFEAQNEQEEVETDEDDKATIFSEARSTISYISAKPVAPKFLTLMD